MTRAILQNTVDVVSVHCVFVWCFVLLIVLFLWWLIFGFGVLICLLCFCSLALSLLFVFSFVFLFHLIYTTNNQLKGKEQRTNTNQWTPKHTKKGHGTNNKNKGHCQSQKKTQFHETRKPTRTIINNTCNVVGVRYVRMCLMFLGIDCVLFLFIRVWLGVL